MERRTQREHCRARRAPDEVDGVTSDNPFFVLALTSHINFQFKRCITLVHTDSTDNEEESPPIVFLTTYRRHLHKLCGFT